MDRAAASGTRRDSHFIMKRTTMIIALAVLLSLSTVGSVPLPERSEEMILDEDDPHTPHSIETLRNIHRGPSAPTGSAAANLIVQPDHTKLHRTEEIVVSIESFHPRKYSKLEQLIEGEGVVPIEFSTQEFRVEIEDVIRSEDSLRVLPLHAVVPTKLPRLVAVAETTTKKRKARGQGVKQPLGGYGIGVGRGGPGAGHGSYMSHWLGT